MQPEPQPPDPEWCLECDRELEIDPTGERWACRRCQRWGSYTIAPNGWRVRVVESAPRATTVLEVPQPKRGRV